MLHVYTYTDEASPEAARTAKPVAAIPAAATTTADPYNIGELLAQAGVTLDAVSNLSLSDDNLVYTPFTQDGQDQQQGSAVNAAAAVEGGGGSAGQQQHTYTDQDIERLIRTAASAAEGDSDGEGSTHKKSRKTKKKKVCSIYLLVVQLFI